MRNIFYRWLAVLGLVCCTYVLSAQIVNIEAKRVTQRDSSEWYGRVDLGLNLVENGNSIVNLNGGLNIEYVKGRHWALSLTNFNFIQIEKEDFINDGFQHFRYNYQMSKRVTFEAFTQAQYNEKLNLRLRWLLGTGARIALVQKEKHKAFLGLTYMYEFNEETNPEMQFRDNRLSTYISLNIKPFSNASISSTTYYQPVLNDFSDLRLSSQTALLIKLTQKLLFTMTFNITYDSRVPESVANTIYSLRNGIRWNF